MSLENYKKFCYYALLSLITGKKHRTIQTYFLRNGLDILSPNDFLKYALENRNI